MIEEKSWASHLFDLCNHLLLIALAVLCIVPFIHVVALSFSSRAAAEGRFVTLWPIGFNLENYARVLQGSAFRQSVIITVQRTVLGTALSLMLTILTAYPLSKSASQLRGRNAMMYLVLFAMLFPAGLIPWFLVINDLGMLDTMWALVIPSALSPWHVILLANFFGDIPPEMEEAAVVDGANQWTVLTRIYVPLSGPAIATMVLLSSVLQWNSWFDGQVLMSTAAKYPLQTYLRLIIVESNAIRQAVGAEGLASISNRGFRGAAIALTTLPILFVYPFIQKYFMTGMRLGAIKG